MHGRLTESLSYFELWQHAILARGSKQSQSSSKHHEAVGFVHGSKWKIAPAMLTPCTPPIKQASPITYHE
jgi:hypothetical protein